MYIFYYPKETDTKAKIMTIHYQPEKLSDKAKNQANAIQVDSIPDPDQTKLDDGYKAISFIDPSTGDIFYEYELKPVIEASNPAPADAETGVSTSPTLSVDVTNPRGELMDITFYDGSDTEIGSATGVDTNASITWDSLNNGTSYNWYVEMTDQFETQTSDVYSFTTA